MSCIFPTCNDKYSNLTSCRETTYFKFPTEPSLRTAWLVALNRAGWQPDDESTVCSKHFLSQDMERTGSGLVIREGAVPVVCVEVCRICLAGNCKLYTITSYKTLQQAYEILTGLMIESEHYLPAWLCNECAHQLLLFTHFRNKSLTTHSALLDIYTKHKCITTDSLNSIQGIQVPVEINQTILYDIDKEIAELENMDSNKQTEMLVPSLNKEVIVDCIKLESDEDINHDTANVEALTNDAMVYISIESLQEYTTEDSFKAENHDIINQNIVDMPGNTSSCMDDGETEEDRPNAEQNTCGELDVSTVRQNLNHLDDHAYSKQETEGKTIDESLQSRDESEMDRQGNTGLQELTDPVEDVIHSTPDKLAETEDDTGETPPEEDVINAKENSTEVEVTKVQEALITIEDSTHRQPDTEDSCIGNLKFSCDICNFQTNTDFQLMSHLKAHAASKSYDCDKCNYKTIYKRSLEWHLKVHTGEKPYSCSRCNKSFIKKSNLQFHIREHLGEKPYVCDLCKKGFSRKDCLKVHLITHSVEKPYPCKICDKAYGDKHNLKKHLRIHSDGANTNQNGRISKSKSNVKPYVCDVCDKTFIRKVSFQKHVRKHLDGTLSCHICRKTFSLKCDLESHLRIHPGEEPYSCNICDKVFLRKGVLVKHNLRLHSGNKPFSCHVCNKTFISKDYLQSHLPVHSVNKLYSCKICNKDFARKTYLRRHMRHHSGLKPYTCDTCNKSFRTKDNIIVHFRVHSGEKPYSCDICKKAFSKKYHLNRHSQVHFFTSLA